MTRIRNRSLYIGAIEERRQFKVPMMDEEWNAALID